VASCDAVPLDGFERWFEKTRRDGDVVNAGHGLLTILVHARFCQRSPGGKALENTRRVFTALSRPNLSLEEIPPLEGTDLFPSDMWKEMFCKALPRVRETVEGILRKKGWDASELERKVQVIPHMDEINGRQAVTWISRLIPDEVAIDFGGKEVVVNGSLYRVAARLGVVNPHFDYYHGPRSMGDLQIQSFAKEAFPGSPAKVEFPMSWVGGRDDEEGHCFGVRPRCSGCLFELFCDRLYLQFDPSEKGMVKA
jgi:hypothetical protein